MSSERVMAAVAAWCILLGCLVLGGCGNADDAFAEAARADTPAAYEQFLADYPEAPQAMEARGRLEVLTAFQSAQDAGTAAGWWDFHLAYASSDVADTARERFLDAVAAEVLAGMPGDSPAPASAQDARRLVDSRTIGTGDASAAALAFLLALAEQMPAKARVVLPCVRSVPGLPVRADAAAIVAGVTGTVTTSLDPKPALEVAGRDLLRDDLGDLLLLSADGPLSVELPGAWLTGVVGRVTLTARAEKGAWLRADLPGEAVLLATRWLGATHPAIPAAPGSVLRLVGSVKGLAPGWTFEGQADDPLVFVFREPGLTNVGGTGRVAGTDGSEILVPSAATALPIDLPVLAEAREGGELPAVRLVAGPRVMTIDNENTLLWMRDPFTTDATAVIRLDFAETIKHDGWSWVKVDRGEETLAELGDEQDVLIREGETYVWAGSLTCDDGWVRYWDLRDERSWYRRRSTTELLAWRLTKDDSAKFTRDFRQESWDGPDANHEGVGGAATIRLNDKGDGFVTQGSHVFGFGKLLLPAIPLVRGLANQSPAMIKVRLKAIAPESAATDELFKEIPGLKRLAAQSNLTVQSFIEGLAEFPHFRALMSDRSFNRLQLRAVFEDDNAGGKVQSFGMTPDPKPFQSAGATYTLDLPADTPYPLAPDLSVWGGRIRVVKDIDGRPLKWVDDGAGFRLEMARLLLPEGSANGGGKLGIVAVGTYADGYPKSVAGVLRQAAYLSGPIEGESIMFNGAAGEDAAPGKRRLEFSRFGETLGLPGE